MFHFVSGSGILKIIPGRGRRIYFRLLDLFFFLSVLVSWWAVKSRTKISSKSFIISSFSSIGSPPFYGFIIHVFACNVNRKEGKKFKYFEIKSLELEWFCGFFFIERKMEIVCFILKNIR